MAMQPSQISHIVVHCSDTGASMDIGVADIDRWHRERGWEGCGYHYVIRRNGAVERGRQLTEAGAHARGHNATSWAICLVGGKGASQGIHLYAPVQLRSLLAVLESLKALAPRAEVVGHADLPGVAKTCPNFNVRDWWRVLSAGRPA